MPRRARSSAPMRIWVVVAGWVTMLTGESPRLLLKQRSTRSALQNGGRRPALPPARPRKLTSVPPAAHLRAWRARAADGRPRVRIQHTRLMLGGGLPAQSASIGRRRAHMAASTRSAERFHALSAAVQALKGDKGRAGVAHEGLQNLGRSIFCAAEHGAADARGLARRYAWWQEYTTTSAPNSQRAVAAAGWRTRYPPPRWRRLRMRQVGDTACVGPRYPAWGWMAFRSARACAGREKRRRARRLMIAGIHEIGR